MAIYGRFGDKLTIERVAKLEDVQALEGRKPDKKDREAIANGSYVVVRYQDNNGKSVLYHMAYLRADGGFAEIDDAIKATGAAGLVMGGAR